MKKIEKRVIKANMEILEYMKKSLKKEDFLYTNKIGFGGDKTLKIDKIFEDIFIKNLKDFGNIFSEECGFKDFKKDFTFVIDPLDGSNNFFSNIPYFGTSVAMKKDEKTIAGFVANLANETLIYKILNKKPKYISLLTGKKIKRVENISSKVAVFERGYKYPNICKILNSKGIKFRVLGATALSLANARDFTFVLFKGDLREFDIDAGLFISKRLYIKKEEDMIFVTKYKEVFSSFNEIIKQF